MKLESLKNGKFRKEVLSVEAMLLYAGGKTISTMNYSIPSDIETYTRTSSKNGCMYDRHTTDPWGKSFSESCKTIYPGTRESWYD